MPNSRRFSALQTEEEQRRYSPRPGPLHRQRYEGCQRQSRSQAREYVLRGTAEPHHANVNAPIHTINQCLLKKVRESLPLGCALFHATVFAASTRHCEFTPAMEAGLADHVGSLEELVGLLDS
jgi:hypothetical protein